MHILPVKSYMIINYLLGMVQWGIYSIWNKPNAMSVPQSKTFLERYVMIDTLKTLYIVT